MPIKMSEAAKLSGVSQVLESVLSKKRASCRDSTRLFQPRSDHWTLQSTYESMLQ